MNLKQALNEEATKYHVIHSGRGWRFFKEGAKRSYIRSKNKSKVMVEAVYKIANDGGNLIVHNEDGSVDFILDNWYG
jgi:hypothetical protein